MLLLFFHCKSDYLRHFVAVDHANKNIVLAIRGTFTISEVVVDAAGFSRKCFTVPIGSTMKKQMTAIHNSQQSIVRRAQQARFVVGKHTRKWQSWRNACGTLLGRQY